MSDTMFEVPGFRLKEMTDDIARLSAENARLREALLHIKRYAEDHDDEWVPHRVDDALIAVKESEPPGG